MKTEQFKFTDIIWRFHMDAKLEELYFSLRKSDGSFYMQHNEQIWNIAAPADYVAQVFGIWNKVVVVQYFHREQLHKVSFFAAYRFGTQEPLWTNTEKSIAEMHGPYLLANLKQGGPQGLQYILIEDGSTLIAELPHPENEHLWINASVSIDKHQIDLPAYKVTFDLDFNLTVALGDFTILEERVAMEEQEWNHLHDYIIAYGDNKLLLLTGKHSCSLYSFK